MSGASAQGASRAGPPTPTAVPSRAQTYSADSPVMNETLSVIDEHITDMNSPRSSFTNGNKRDTIGSVYSTHALSRMSYIPGHETDEDEHQLHTEDEVMNWSPMRVAEYLEDLGVEKAHCNVFKDQEISGEVLLAMDQSSIFIKEFDLGPVGRRLKTWHKIKALQDEVRMNTGSAVTPEHSNAGAAQETVIDAGRNRSSTMGSALPRGLDTRRQSVDSAGRSNTLQGSSSGSLSAHPSFNRTSAVISPLQSMTSMSRPENTYRPSAQSIRSMNAARRHSSVDSLPDAASTARATHRKVPSLDKTWQPGQSAQTNGKSSAHAHTMSADPKSQTPPQQAPNLNTPSSPSDFDRGYFSSNELDNRTSPKKPNLLVKKSSLTADSPAQSRTNSFLFNGQSSQSSRMTSLDSSRERVTPSPNIPPTYSMFGAVSAVQSKFGGLRSATSPPLQPQQSKRMTETNGLASPVVTKLEYSGTKTPNLKPVTTSPSMAAVAASTDGSNAKESPSPSTGSFSFFGKSNGKVTGLRAISDAITNKEKTMAVIPSAGVPPAIKEGEVQSPTRTGSTTPSTEARSFDGQKSNDAQSRVSTGSGNQLLLPPTTKRSTRPKTKKATSAYTRGLEKKTPAEAMQNCDYSGWMKKKSGSLMTTWKPRLFILKGRRLSYYYSETDTEEKGLIDISFHRVLPAHNETLTGLHAAVTGAAGTPSSPTHTSTPTTAQQDLAKQPPGIESGGEGLFIFKLVPPKSGLAKGVNFTKPTVHYFAVNSRQEGRLWMAALVKATIDRDEDGVVTTTYTQKTISLAKARARRERPPALKEEEVEGRAELDGASGSEQGLGIAGLSEDNSQSNSAIVVGGAEEEKHESQPDDSSIQQSPIVGPVQPASELLGDEERAVVAIKGDT